MNATINHYPESVQTQIKDVLTAYPSVWVFKKGDTYRVSTGIGITLDGNGGETVEAKYLNTDFYTQVEIDKFNGKLPDFNW